MWQHETQDVRAEYEILPYSVHYVKTPKVPLDGLQFTLVGPQLTSDIYPHDKSKAIDERLASILLINDYSEMTT